MLDAGCRDRSRTYCQADSVHKLDSPLRMQPGRPNGNIFVFINFKKRDEEPNFDSSIFFTLY